MATNNGWYENNNDVVAIMGGEKQVVAINVKDMWTITC